MRLTNKQTLNVYAIKGATYHSLGWRRFHCYVIV